MKIIAGLGNPGRQYSETRHNVGFKVLEELARRYPIEKEQYKFTAIIGHTRIGTDRILLVKPLTYMNLSGRAVAPLVRFYKLPWQNLLVIYDDMDLEPGQIRIKPFGGSGGHRGMNSVMDSLGSKEFPRIRVGIGRPRDETVEWVLGTCTGAERQVFEMVIQKAADAVECWVQQGIDKAMNQYNQKAV